MVNQSIGQIFEWLRVRLETIFQFKTNTYVSDTMTKIKMILLL